MGTICSVEGCGDKHYGKGFCSKHYMRVRRKGTLQTTKAPNGARLNWIRETALLWESDDCLLLPFGAGSHGYGAARAYGEAVLVHRYICEAAHGAPPTSLHDAAHSCGRKLCANKRHIRWATRQENEADKLLHGTRARGERHGHVKLTEAEVLAIRSARGRQADIADAFGIVQQTVSDIKTGRRWRWL